MGDRLRRLLRAGFGHPIALPLAAASAVEAGRLVLARDPLDLLVLAAMGAVALAVVRSGGASGRDGATRGAEAESFARMLRGLSRSVSPDAIVGAIVEELGAGTGADHVSVVRRRPEACNLEAVLSPTRPGAPASRTYLPLSELEDPALEMAGATASSAAARGRRFAAVPIQPDADGDPQLVGLGLARPRPATVGASLGPAAGQSEGQTASPAAGAGPLAPAAPDLRRSVAPAAPAPQHAPPLRADPGQRIADRIAGRLQDEYGLRNVVAAPLRVDGRVEGAIVLSRRTDEPWAPRARGLLAAAAVEASAALARVSSLRDAEARATMDALTGLPNRRYFDEYLGLLARRRRAEDRVGVLMVDIDRFKQLNDTFGHAVGDQVLREVAQALAGAVREGDVPARFGGEEFVVLLRNPGLRIAVEVGERVRLAVAALDLRRLGVTGVSVSVGVAVAEGPEAELHDVIDEADRALYRAKRAGRDRVVAA